MYEDYEAEMLETVDLDLEQGNSPLGRNYLLTQAFWYTEESNNAQLRV